MKIGVARMIHKEVRSFSRLNTRLPLPPNANTTTFRQSLHKQMLFCFDMNREFCSILALEVFCRLNNSNHLVSVRLVLALFLQLIKNNKKNALFFNLVLPNLFVACLELLFITSITVVKYATDYWRCYYEEC